MELRLCFDYLDRFEKCFNQHASYPKMDVIFKEAMLNMVSMDASRGQLSDALIYNWLAVLKIITIVYESVKS
ncbi:hypothetical protein AGMMS49929_10640 [Endomicrobiia bacterium]|nr:hypothetical protein AGMMS49571_10940 [Endomicrobiia bacterium]GHT21731.1 hypothetical protein AGMMS49929_10640 [Endomicrobiia bacterium]GHT28949.1 hypothetical protein AGMMS49995_10620 [Endomicrobiia bacterium]